MTTTPDASVLADRLFRPLQLGPLTLPNRVVMAPMTRTRAGEGHAPTALNAQYFEQRASGGLLLSEATQVVQVGAGGVRTPGIYSQAQIEGWRLVTKAVHAAGGRIFLQLWHAGRASHPSLNDEGLQPVAPSAIAIDDRKVFTPQGLVPYPVPRALEEHELPGIVAAFAQGAKNAIAAGFDGVEIHGANGYLIDQFLRDGSNLRTDRYGGSIENRLRLLTEITDAVVAAVGKERVGVRLSPWVAHNNMKDSNPPALFTAAAKALRGKVVYLHVIEPVAGPAKVAAPILPLLKEAFGGVVIANGGYTGETARAVLQSGAADAVAFGVPFLANPDLPERLLRNAPLNAPNPQQFFAEGPVGYTDYPRLSTL